MLSETEIKHLIALAGVYDQRRPPADPTAARMVIRSWQDASDRGRWTYTAAAEAIKAHYAETTDYLMPGHITALLRDRRRQPPSLAETRAALPPADPASAAQVAAVVAEVGRDLGWSDHTLEARSALSVACPWCRARPGEPCTRPNRAGGNVATRPHPIRREAAEKATNEEICR